MEKFIEKAGKLVARVRSWLNYFLEQKIGDSRANLIYFLISIFIGIIFICALFFGFQGVFEYYWIYLILLAILVLSSVWVAIYYESNKHLETDRHPFKMEILKRSVLKYNLINIEKEYRPDFDRLLKGRNVKTRINYTMGNKSGGSANHRILFILFDETIVGGIKDLTGERKKHFFQLLVNSFLMNNEPLKENTLKTSFSSWKNEQEKLNSRNQRELVKQMLGKE